MAVVVAEEVVAEEAVVVVAERLPEGAAEPPEVAPAAV